MDAQRVRRRTIARRIAAGALGAAAAAAVIPALGVVAGLLAGWAALTLASAVLMLLEIWPMDGAQTAAHASLEAPGRRFARLIAVVGSIVSLAAVVMVIVQARNASGGEAIALAAIALVSVVSSWLLIQTDYMLRYASIYYEADEQGAHRRGIDYNQDDDPCYTDFAYFAVGLGLTYQVSDTNLTDPGIRRVVIAQTMLAYLFGAGILATVINLVAGLG